MTHIKSTICPKCKLIFPSVFAPVSTRVSIPACPLHAAAPALLEALKAVTANFNAYVPQKRAFDQSVKVDRDAWEAACAAIEKAGG